MLLTIHVLLLCARRVCVLVFSGFVRVCADGCVMRRVCMAGAVAASGGTGDPASGAVARAAWRGVAFWGAVAVSRRRCVN